MKPSSSSYSESRLRVQIWRRTYQMGVRKPSRTSTSTWGSTQTARHTGNIPIIRLRLRETVSYLAAPNSILSQETVKTDVPTWTLQYTWRVLYSRHCIPHSSLRSSRASQEPNQYADMKCSTCKMNGNPVGSFRDETWWQTGGHVQYYVITLRNHEEHNDSPCPNTPI